jgi:hypothetical protein
MPFEILVSPYIVLEKMMVGVEVGDLKMHMQFKKEAL